MQRMLYGVKNSVLHVIKNISVNLELRGIQTKCVCPLTALLHLLKLSPSKILSASAAE